MKSDLGPHRIHSCIPEMQEWFRDVVGHKMYEVRRVSRMYVGGRYVRYPPSAAQMTRALGPATLARFGLGYLCARARALAGRLGADSFGAVMEGAFGRPLCGRLVFPYIRKVWRTGPYELSADVARTRATTGGLGRMIVRMATPCTNIARTDSLRRFHYLHGGIETLVHHLADEIR